MQVNHENFRSDSVEHSEKKSVCCFISAKVITNTRNLTRTELSSFKLSCKSIVIAMTIYGLNFALSFIYGPAAFNYSIASNGISKLQASSSPETINFFKIQTTFGGGNELTAISVIAFIFMTRSKCLYYMAAFTLDKTFLNFYKLAFADPRPYMIDSNITPYSCSTGFGNPSGHASASAVFFIFLFLDIFHGSTHYGTPSFFKTWQYVLCFLIGGYWAVSIPFTRYLMGAHSLDQIIFGSINGLIEGLILHFVLRDPILYHSKQMLSKSNSFEALYDSGKTTLDK